MGFVNIISKLRTSSHDLKIETGRHRKIPTTERKCMRRDIR